MAVDSDLLRRRIERLEGLPTLPAVVKSLSELASNPRTSAKEIGELISRDQALTSRVLRLVNSAYYGFPKQIATVKHAVVILGFNRVKNVVLAASVFGMDDRRKLGIFEVTAFWKHSLGTAVAARSISRHLSWGDPEEAFVCGLLHDIGKPILAQSLHAEYDKCLALAEQRPCTLLEAETELLGLTHSDAGSWLAERWALPTLVQVAIADHHLLQSTGQGREAAQSTHLGDICARSLLVGSGGDHSMPRVHPSLAPLLQSSPSLIGALLDEVIVDLRNAKDFFEML